MKITVTRKTEIEGKISERSITCEFDDSFILGPDEPIPQTHFEDMANIRARTLFDAIGEGWTE